MRIDLARREHDFSLGQRPHGRYIAAIIVLHLALFWAATRPVHMRIELDARVWLQLAPPLPPTRRLIVPAKPDPAPARAPALPSSAASVSPPETAHTRLAKGFAQAHAAVKPKWFEAARIELWSAPNDPKRIYRVITATGEYCIYLPDKGSMSLNLSARSGYAGFGEGTAAPCPIRF